MELKSIWPTPFGERKQLHLQLITTIIMYNESDYLPFVQIEERKSNMYIYT